MEWVRVVTLHLCLFLLLISAVGFRLHQSERVSASILHRYPQVQLRYYSVATRSFRDLRSEMLIAAPRDTHGRRCFAYTTWKLSWNWAMDSKNTIDLINSSLETDVEILLPQWTHYEHAPFREQQAWNRFIQSILTHEYGHVEAIFRKTNTIRNTIREMSKPTLQRLNRFMRSQVSKAYRADEEYDKRTLGGRTQGVWLRLSPAIS